ncbi:hypothetical protein FQZ97_627160 [compost metagenome]
MRRGRWDELDPSLVSALMVQLGLLREDDESGGNRRRSKQPQSHDSALPPGFGTMDRNGMNGARIGRRGKLQGGRQGSAGQAQACPSDPFGTGLMIAGGYANGHPLAGEGGNRKGGKPAGGRPSAAGGKAGGKPGGKSGGKGRGPRAASANGPSGNAATGNVAEAPAGAGRKAAGGGKPGGKPAGARGGNAAGRTGKPAAGGRGGNKAEGARSGGNKGPGAGGKPRAPRSAAPRGDDWQPRGASAHESRLGVMGGRSHRGR